MVAYCVYSVFYISVNVVFVNLIFHMHLHRVRQNCYRSGFAVADPDDDQVDGGSGVRTLSCGTEKGKHRCKNRRTAGSLCFLVQFIYVNKCKLYEKWKMIFIEDDI